MLAVGLACRDESAWTHGRTNRFGTSSGADTNAIFRDRFKGRFPRAGGPSRTRLQRRSHANRRRAYLSWGLIFEAG